MHREADFFEKELALIRSDNLRTCVYNYLTNAVPSYFWDIGASSSGRFHPCFTKREGGLVRHTKSVAKICDELLRIEPYCQFDDFDKDLAIACCLVHDCFKYGSGEIIDKESYREHDVNGARHFKHFMMTFSLTSHYDDEIFKKAFRGIACHMGKWASKKEYRPANDFEQLIHLADYVASRAFFDIPGLTNEWEEMKTLIDDELPF